MSNKLLLVNKKYNLQQTNTYNIKVEVVNKLIDQKFISLNIQTSYVKGMASSKEKSLVQMSRDSARQTM